MLTRRIARTLTSVAGVAGLATWSVVLLASSPSGAASQTFTSNATFTVPPNVCAVAIDAIGASGGSPSGGGAAGGGGEVQGTFTVTPGNQLQIVIGQVGTASTTSGVAGPGGAGLNAGGNGGVGDSVSAGGGGSSGVTLNGVALAIAGGGGGGGDNVNNGGNGAGGGGTPVVNTGTGAAAGFDGLPPSANPVTHAAQGGFGGTNTGAGGAGGASDAFSISDGPGVQGDAFNGAAAGMGGDGGISGGADGGGGGGGGWSGGGGGGGANSLSGAGGGGSSFANPTFVVAGTTVFPNPAAPHVGSGSVTLTPVAGTCPAAPTTISPTFTG